MSISVTFRILSFRTLPFIPQKKSASNFPQITRWELSAFRNPHSAKYPFPLRIVELSLSQPSQDAYETKWLMFYETDLLVASEYEITVTSVTQIFINIFQ